MDNVEKLDGLSGFVRLQMADKMPFGGGAADLGDLVFGFLHFIFAKNIYACSDRVSQSFGRVRFADGYELYLIGVSSDTSCSLLDSSPYVGEICLYIALHTVKYSKIRRSGIILDC